MNTQDLEQKIKKSYEDSTPDVFDAVLQGCDLQKGKVLVMNPTNTKKRLITTITAIAACLLLAVGIYGYSTEIATAATISLDVNPSIELTVNKNNKVLEATALNAEGIIVLGEMDVKGSDAELAVNAIVGSMVRNGFINDVQNSILLTVEDADAVAGEQLQQQLAFEIENVIADANIEGAILSQSIDTVNTAEIAELYGISDGKANLINELLVQTPTYDAVQLAKLSITELGLLLNSSEIIKNNGSSSDKAYIGSEAAISAALAVATLTTEQIIAQQTEIDFDDGVMIYEVEFTTVTGDEYSYDIDALTGSVLQSEIDLNDDNHDDADDADDADDIDDILDDIDDDLDDMLDDLDDANDDMYDDDDYDDYDDYDDDDDDDYDYDDDDDDDDDGDDGDDD